MLLVPMTQARPGMTLALPVLDPLNPTRVLLRAGFEVDRATIEKMKEHAIASVWIRYPGLEFVSRFVSPEISRARGALAHTVAGVVDRMATDSTTPADYATYRAAIRGFIETVTERPECGLLVQNMSEANHPLVRHCADVCFLALLMGMRLEHYLVAQRERLPEYRARSITDLGVAALLHDVGMLAMSPEAYRAWVAGGCDERDPAWREHVVLGYERVREHISPAAAAAVLHHHQKYDGTGFPERVTIGDTRVAPAGEDIHIYARILYAASVFDRLRFPEDGSGPVPAVRALRTMQRRPVVNWVDPVVFRALLSVAPAYPPGALVGLSTGEQAVVIDWSSADPCRPVVQVLDDRVDLASEEPVRYDLRLRREVTITHADDIDVRADNFYPRRDGEFELYITNSSAMTPLDSDQEGGSSATAA